MARSPITQTHRRATDTVIAASPGPVILAIVIAAPFAVFTPEQSGYQEVRSFLSDGLRRKKCDPLDTLVASHARKRTSVAYGTGSLVKLQLPSAVSVHEMCDMVGRLQLGILRVAVLATERRVDL